MDYRFSRIADAAPGQTLIQVQVHQDGQPLAGVTVQLYGSPWINLNNPPLEVVTGTKDAEHPGLVEIVHVEPRNRLAGIEVQPGRFVYLYLPMLEHGIYALDVDLTQPWQAPVPESPPEAPWPDEYGLEE